MKKYIIVPMIITFLVISNILPLIPSSAFADLIKGDQIYESVSESSNNVNEKHTVSTEESENGSVTNVVVELDVNQTQTVLNQMKVGKYAQISAYKMESLQGKNRGTFVPNLDKILDSEHNYEYDTSGIKETTYFTESNKKDYFFDQDGRFSLEYGEALNWLYRNNMIHLNESLDISYEPNPDTYDGDILAEQSAQGGIEVFEQEYDIYATDVKIVFDSYTIPDTLVIVNDKGEDIVNEQFSGERTFELKYDEDSIEETPTVEIETNDDNPGISKEEIKKKRHKFKITVNPDNKGLDGTAWEYKIIAPNSRNYEPKGITTVDIIEEDQTKSFYYPFKNKSSKKNRPIKKKDFIMQLMKAVDGVEYSRPLYIESQFEYIDLEGVSNPEYYTLNSLKSKYKEEIGGMGIDQVLNVIDIEFNRFGMHRVYVNPNVYELYLRKAYNLGIITKEEIADENILMYLNQEDNNLNEAYPAWDNNLGPVRINTLKKYANGYGNMVDNNVGVFGKSWSNVTKVFSDEKINGEKIEYDNKYQYFMNEGLSYIDTVVYAYKAINAFADEKLPQREVDILTSMYGLNYGKLSDEEKTALDYLVAKGIIDGDNSSKWTSTEQITVEDAIVLAYRVANKDARLTFKQTFTTVDEEMFKRGFYQSQVDVIEVESAIDENENQTSSSEVTDEDLSSALTVNDIKEDFPIMEVGSGFEVEMTILGPKGFMALDLQRLSFLYDGNVAIPNSLFEYEEFEVTEEYLESLGFYSQHSDLMKGAKLKFKKEIVDKVEYFDMVRLTDPGNTKFISNRVPMKSGFYMVYGNEKIEEMYYTDMPEELVHAVELIPNMSSSKSKLLNINQYFNLKMGDKEYIAYADAMIVSDCIRIMKGYEHDTLSEYEAKYKECLGDLPENSKNKDSSNGTSSIFNVLNSNKDSGDGDNKEENKPNPETIIEKQNDEEENETIESILYYSNPFTLELNKYKSTETEGPSVYIGINAKAKDQITFDAKKLFVNNAINPELIIEDGDLTNIQLVNSVPDYVASEWTYTDSSSTFVKFTFPVTNKRPTSELTSLIKRRLVLSAEGELSEESISAYSSGPTGHTMISIRELDRFGITTSQQNPDILVHQASGMKAYIDAEKNYAFVGNNVIKFPDTSVMIQIDADEIYYNLKAIMPLLNSSEYYVFNESNKVQLVTKLRDIQLANITGVNGGEIKDKTYIANIDKYRQGSTTQKESAGSFINMSAINGDSATFIISKDYTKNRGSDKQIIAFKPYNNSQTATSNTGVTEEQLIRDLSNPIIDVAFAENLLINNAVLRDKFNVDKADTFVHADNALSVTHLTPSSNHREMATKYLQFIETLTENISDKDVRYNTKYIGTNSALLANDKFKLKDLLVLNNFQNSTNEKTKKLVANANANIDTKSFWTLFFLSKFSFDIPDLDNNGTVSNDIQTFENELYSLFNSKYKFSGVTLSSREDLKLLMTRQYQNSTLLEKRVYAFKSMIKTPNGGKISTDGTIFEHVNDSLYTKLTSFGTRGSNNLVAINTPIDNLDSTNTILFDNYASSGVLTAEQESQLGYMRDIFGSTIFRHNNTLVAPVETSYRSLSDGQTPLELMPTGTKFKIETSPGIAREMVVINNYYLTSRKHATIKVALVDASPIPNYTGDVLQAYKDYYISQQKYNLSKQMLGIFSSAVNTGHQPIERTISSGEIQASLTGGGFHNSIYFNIGSKASNTAYLFATDLDGSSDKAYLVPAYARHKYTGEVTTNTSRSDTILGFGGSLQNNKYKYNFLKANNFEVPALYNSNSLPSVKHTIYESYLFDYGTVAVDADMKAVYSRRNSNIINESPTLNDIVSELVTALELERIDIKPKTLKDLGTGDKILLNPNDNRTGSLILINTSTPDKNGYTHFITSKPVSQSNISQADLQNANVLLMKNYSMLDRIKVSTSLQRYSLYHFVGNRQLNLPTEAELKENKNSLDLMNYGTNFNTLIEVKVGGTPTTKKYNIGSGSSSNLAPEERQIGYPYFLSLYLDSNLTVKKNSSGYYEIDGYADNELLNTKAFTSRANKFEGTFGNLLTILPTYSVIDGKFLGFDLSKLEVDTLLKLFTLKFWQTFFNDLILNTEQILSALGIWYVYLLLVMITLARAMPRPFYTLFFSPVRLMTLGRVDVDTVDMRKTVPVAILSVMALTLTYNGFIRVLIVKTEEVRQLVADYIFILF